MPRTRNPEKTRRKWVKGGCRKCRQPAENHARGLCGRCEGVERKRGRIDRWPKIGPESLSETPDKAPELPLPATAPPLSVPAPAPITLTFDTDPRAAELGRILHGAAAQNWRTPAQEVFYRLSLAGSKRQGAQP